MSLAPLRSFHQRSIRVRALIWGGAISAADVTPFPGQSSFSKGGGAFIPEERRGQWTSAPGVETLLTLSRQNAPLPLHIKWHQFPNPSRVFPFYRSSFLSFASFPNNTNNSVRVPFASLSDSFFFPSPFKPLAYKPLSVFSVSQSFPSLRLLLSSSSRSPRSLSSSDNCISPTPFLASYDTLPPPSFRTRGFRSCDIEQIEECA